MKTKAKNLLKILIILCLIIATILLAQFAWAKYIKQINGQATAKVAEMKFTINGDYYKSTEKINFSSCRDDSNPKIDKDMLAPGTYGHIPIIIDATESKTSLEYEISIDLTNRPTNLKFYSDSNMVNEIIVNNNKIIRKGYIPLTTNNESKIKSETIYWNWATETGENGYEINENDKEDSKFMDKVMEIQINVKGTQVNESPLYLGDNSSIGDIVYYKAHNAEDFVKFMIVNITPDNVEMMPVDNDGYAEIINISSFNDYDNIDKARKLYNSIIQILNKEAIDGFSQKYGYTISTRALTVDDVNRLTGYKPKQPNKIGIYTTNTQKFLITPQTEVSILEKDNSITMKLATLLTKNGKQLLVGDEISVGDIVDLGEITEIRIPYSAENQWYEYKKGNTENSTLVTDYINSKCLLASRCIAIKDNTCSYCIRFFYKFNNSIYSFNICSDVRGNVENLPNKIVPVISIPATAHTKQITDENNTDKVIWEVTE